MYQPSLIYVIFHGTACIGFQNDIAFKLNFQPQVYCYKFIASSLLHQV